jgi:hypothetical protein
MLILFSLLHKLSCRDWFRRKQVEDSAEMEENVADIYENKTSRQFSTFFDRLCFWFICVLPMSAGVYMKTRFSHLNLSEVKTLIDEQDSKEQLVT